MKKQKKALLVTTVSGFIPQFEMHNVQILQQMGFEIHYATNYNMPSYGTDNHRLDGTGIIRHQIDFVRSPFRLANIVIYRQLCDLMRREQFSLVHCHTPMGGVMARLAAHATSTGPVIYTAHGFHFYKGAPLVHWLCYFPMERFLSRFTDQQICINQEDYQIAQKTFHAKYIDYTPGVGIDLNRFPAFNRNIRQAKRQELGICDQQIVLLSSGELIKRKNHETVLRAIAKLLRDTQKSGRICPDFHYYICGHGKLASHLTSVIENLKISDHVTMLGYRNDMALLYQAADIFLFPSYQEGLPISLLEAMACGLPVICSDIRGNRDLMGSPKNTSHFLEYCTGGIMIQKADDTAAYCDAIMNLISNKDKLSQMGLANHQQACNFSISTVSSIMRNIYRKLLICEQ